MPEFLTYAEIENRFDSEWVVIENPETSDDLSIRSGTVLWHSTGRDEVYRKALELRPQHAAILYLGRLPENGAIVL